MRERDEMRVSACVSACVTESASKDERGKVKESIGLLRTIFSNLPKIN